MKIGKVNILGIEYEIHSQTSSENVKLTDNDGICEYYAHKIILDLSHMNEDLVWDNKLEYYRHVLRHEIIHALLHEAGLSNYSQDEALVEALAILYPKMLDTMISVEIEFPEG